MLTSIPLQKSSALLGAYSVSWTTGMPWLEILSPAEQAFLQTLTAPTRQQTFAWGRWLVRTSLSRHASVASSGWGISLPGTGRPTVLAPALAKPLFFSLSHCDNRAVCAIAKTPSIGIDIEDTRRSIRIAAVAQRLFAPDEQTALSAEPDQRALFFTLWTRREAFAKASGLSVLKSRQLSMLIPPPSWTMQSITLENHYRLSLSIKKN
ncbi:MAG: 4'-phosphopantetheinyl transferase family protein [Holosporales bacterium]